MTSYLGKAKNLSKNNQSVTAKLSQKIMFDLASGKVEISKSSLHFILYSINFVAKDGRIYASQEEIKNALNFQSKTLVRVIAELTKLNLLSFENDGYFYSHFHVLSSGKHSDETYVRNLNVFTSPTVLNLKKNELRLFLYVASRSLINNIFKRSAIETLYSNDTHSGVPYIDSYLSLSMILNTLISKDLIEIKFNDVIYAKENIDNFLPALHNFCGYEDRKKRMSKNPKNKHVIGLRVNKKFIDAKDVRENIAARAEIEQFAELNGFFHSDLQSSTIPILIGNVQNVLFNTFGVVGYKIYREALFSYFEKEVDNVVYHDLYADNNGSKAINTMMDFFLIPKIIKLIVEAASPEPTDDPHVNYFKDKENLAKLVTYFHEFGSHNHYFLLDKALEAANLSLRELTAKNGILNGTENSCFSLLAEIKQLYKKIKHHDNTLSEAFKKGLIREWAEVGLFTQRKQLEQEIKDLNEKVKLSFVPSDQYKELMRELKNGGISKEVAAVKNKLSKVKSSEWVDEDDNPFRFDLRDENVKKQMLKAIEYANSL